jgi:siroheme synthase
MGAANISEIAERLVSEGLTPSTPVLAVNNGTTPRERRVCADLGTIAHAANEAQFRGPVLFLVGAVVSLYQQEQICPLLREVVPLSQAEAEDCVYA